MTSLLSKARKNRSLALEARDAQSGTRRPALLGAPKSDMVVLLIDLIAVPGFRIRRARPALTIVRAA